MELKFWYYKFKNFGFSSFNRTFMELKFMYWLANVWGNIPF